MLGVQGRNVSGFLTIDFELLAMGFDRLRLISIVSDGIQSGTTGFNRIRWIPIVGDWCAENFSTQ